MGTFDLSYVMLTTVERYNWEIRNRSNEYCESRACLATFKVLSYLFDITLTKIPIKHRLAFLKNVIGRGYDQLTAIIKHPTTLINNCFNFSFSDFERLY